MKTKLTLTLITLAGLIVFTGFVRGGNSSAAALATRVNPHYKGASAFNPARSWTKRSSLWSISGKHRAQFHGPGH